LTAYLHPRHVRSRPDGSQFQVTSSQLPTSMSSEDEFPDDFQGVNWDDIDIPALGEASNTAHTQVHDPPPTPQSDTGSSNSSIHYLCDDDDIDEAFLAEVDALEQQATQGVAAATSSIDGSGIQISRFFTGSSHDPPLRAPHAWPQSRQKSAHNNTSFRYRNAQNCNAQCSPPPSPSRKSGKMKSNEDNNIRQILEDFEDEITCPICCDIFVAAHLGNPCGHSFCGECGLNWIASNRPPTCAICRSKLSTIPMIPNFVVDSTVDKYVKALALSDNVDWKPGGKKLLEWTARKEQWKKGAAARASGPRLRPRPRPRPPAFDDFDLLMDEVEGEVFGVWHAY